MNLKISIQIVVIFIFFLICVSCRSPESSGLKKSKQFKLPGYLKEVSGLAVSDDGRIFCHDDEKGILYEINYAKGKVEKIFGIDDPIPSRDFEGIAIVKDTFYLITSSGDLYKFKEAPDKKKSSSKIYKTGLTVSYNIEGLCYDPVTNSLLLACKSFPGKNYKGNRAVYSYDLKEKKLNPKPRFLLSLKILDKEYGMKNFSPSAIEYNPGTGTFFILSSHVKALIELSPAGKILNGILLPDKDHKQPEGIAFTHKSEMLISDEGKGGDGTIIIYPLKNQKTKK